jgi:hypothetical protein
MVHQVQKEIRDQQQMAVERMAKLAKGVPLVKMENKEKRASVQNIAVWMVVYFSTTTVWK